MAPLHEGAIRRPRRAARAPKPARLRDACNQCHAAKVKCSGEKAGCGRCTAQSLQCVYSESRAGKVPGKRARNHDGPAPRANTPVDAQLPNTNDAAVARTPNDPFSSSSASRPDWAGSWAAELNSYDHTDAPHDSIQALVWSPLQTDFTTANALAESLEHEIHAPTFRLSTDPTLEVHSHSQATMPGNDQARCSGAEKEHALVDVCLSPPTGLVPSVGHSGDGTSSSSLSSGLVFSDIQNPLPDIPSFPTLGDCSPAHDVGIAAPSTAGERPQSDFTAANNVGADAFPPAGTQESVCIDELKFVHVVCQLVESLQNSITTQVKVLDLLLSMVHKTVNALGTLVQIRSGRHIKLSPHCLALLYSCMFQVVELATLGRECLREEMAAESKSSRSAGDDILNSLDFAGFSSDTSYKRVWRARRAAERLDSTAQEVRAILASVSSTSESADGGGRDPNSQACLDGIVISLQRLVQAYREMSYP